MAKPRIFSDQAEVAESNSRHNKNTKVYYQETGVSSRLNCTRNGFTFEQPSAGFDRANFGRSANPYIAVEKTGNVREWG